VGAVVRDRAVAARREGTVELDNRVGAVFGPQVEGDEVEVGDIVRIAELAHRTDFKDPTDPTAVTGGVSLILGAEEDDKVEAAADQRADMLG
jgi:hypothetical protein